MNAFYVVLAIAVASASAANQTCEPGKKFKDYCNTCICSDDGTTAACTLALCDENVWNKDGTMKDRLTKDYDKDVITEGEQKCNEGDTVKYYCNTCTCGKNNELYACTLMSCSQDLWNEDGSLRSTSETTVSDDKPEKVCRPGTKFQDYCNTCSCGEDGIHYACTLMYCDPSIYNQDGSLKINPLLVNTEEPSEVDSTTTEAADEKMCEPLTTFKSYCNSCKCSADGKKASCTLMACDENVWNKDGTMKKIETSSTEQVMVN